MSTNRSAVKLFKSPFMKSSLNKELWSLNLHCGFICDTIFFLAFSYRGRITVLYPKCWFNHEALSLCCECCVCWSNTTNKGFSVLSTIIQETNQFSSVTSGLIIVILRCFLDKSLRKNIMCFMDKSLRINEICLLIKTCHTSKLFT